MTVTYTIGLHMHVVVKATFAVDVYKKLIVLNFFFCFFMEIVERERIRTARKNLQNRVDP